MSLLSYFVFYFFLNLTNRNFFQICSLSSPVKTTTVLPGGTIQLAATAGSASQGVGDGQSISTLTMTNTPGGGAIVQYAQGQDGQFFVPGWLRLSLPNWKFHLSVLSLFILFIIFLFLKLMTLLPTFDIDLLRFFLSLSLNLCSVRHRRSSSLRSSPSHHHGRTKHFHGSCRRERFLSEFTGGLQSTI